MQKILLVISREYLQRVRKKTFLLLTILGPFLYLLLFAGPMVISQVMQEDRTIRVVDESGLFTDAFTSTSALTFRFSDYTAAEAEKKVSEGKTSGEFFLIIPDMELHNAKTVMLVGGQSPGMQMESTVRNQINNHIEELRLKDYGLDDEVIAGLRKQLVLETKVGSEAGLVDAGSGLASTAGFISGFLIYFFIFAYGGMVLQGVQEEKSSRIVEIIVSSIKPFQLMMGKIAGIALVGLTQLALWVILTFILLVAGGFAIGIFFPEMLHVGEVAEPAMGISPETNPLLGQSFDTLAQINFPLLLFAFVVYFIGGYLLYASMFAAIGAAVENQSDSQQFMMPVSIPLFFGLLSIFPIAENPGGSFAFWLSMIPFTSPITMITRIPFGVPVWELLLSMALLAATFTFITYMAGKIYRTGILLYGTKPTVKEMFRWMF